MSEFSVTIKIIAEDNAYSLYFRRSFGEEYYSTVEALVDELQEIFNTRLKRATLFF